MATGLLASHEEALALRLRVRVEGEGDGWWVVVRVMGGGWWVMGEGER